MIYNLSKKEYIAIVDYKCGNINSIYRILRSLKKNVEVSDKLEILKYSKLIILPGVLTLQKSDRYSQKKKLYNFLKPKFQYLVFVSECKFYLQLVMKGVKLKD